MDNLGFPEPAPVVGHWKECLESLHLKSTNKSEDFISTVSTSNVLKIIKKMKHVGKVGGKCSVSYWRISDKKLLVMVTVRKTSSQSIFSV